jgi:hypothetical protein
MIKMLQCCMYCADVLVECLWSCPRGEAVADPDQASRPCLEQLGGFRIVLKECLSLPTLTVCRPSYALDGL